MGVMVGFGPMLERREEARRRALEALRGRTRGLLRAALEELVPGARVLIFGSIACPGRFREGSDVDLAVETMPAAWSPYALAAEIELRVGRPVDVVLLPDCRFADKLRNEGEWWTT